MKKILVSTICALFSCFLISANAEASSISSYNKEIMMSSLPNVRTETVTTAICTADGGTIAVVRVIVYIDGKVVSDTIEIVFESKRPQS